MSLNRRELYKIMLSQEEDHVQYLVAFEKFDRMLEGLKPSWNQSAFWLSGLWALNRRMYNYFMVWVVVILFISLIYNLICAGAHSCEDATILGWLIYIFMSTLFGLFGNSIFYLHIKRKIEQAQEQFKDEQQLLACLKEEGTLLTKLLK